MRCHSLLRSVVGHSKGELSSSLLLDSFDGGKKKRTSSKAGNEADLLFLAFLDSLQLPSRPPQRAELLPVSRFSYALKSTRASGLEADSIFALLWLYQRSVSLPCSSPTSLPFLPARAPPLLSPPCPLKLTFSLLSCSVQVSYYD